MSEPRDVVHQQAEKDIYSTNDSETNPLEFCKLTSLPYELQLQILSYLRYRTRWALAQTSKYWLNSFGIRQPKSFFTGVLSLLSIPRGGGARHRELVNLNELYTGLQGLDCPRDHGTLTSSTAPDNGWGPLQPCFSCCRFRSARVFDYDQRQVGALHSTRHCVNCGVREGRYLPGIPIFMYSVTTEVWHCERYMVVCTACGKLAKGQGCPRCGMCKECVRAAVVTLRSSINNLSQGLQSPYACVHLRGLDLYKRTKDLTDRRDRYIREQRGPGMSIDEWVAYCRLYYDLP